MNKISEEDKKKENFLLNEGINNDISFIKHAINLIKQIINKDDLTSNDCERIASLAYGIKFTKFSLLKLKGIKKSLIKQEKKDEKVKT